MERGKKTSFILRQFKRKSKRLVHKDYFTEFFYLNRERRIIEFLTQDDNLCLETFFKKFLPVEFRSFVSLTIMNDMEEEIKTWYYDTENLVLIISTNWGFNKQDISIDISIENFVITIMDEKGMLMRSVDYAMLNDYLISFLTLQARSLAETFENISEKKESQRVKERKREEINT